MTVLTHWSQAFLFKRTDEYCRHHTMHPQGQKSYANMTQCINNDRKVLQTRHTSLQRWYNASSRIEEFCKHNTLHPQGQKSTADMTQCILKYRRVLQTRHNAFTRTRILQKWHNASCPLDHVLLTARLWEWINKKERVLTGIIDLGKTGPFFICAPFLKWTSDYQASMPATVLSWLPSPV